MSSAPPLESCRTSWNTPLPNVRVPTTSARSRSCSAPVTISDADADSPLTSTTTGILASIGSPVASNTRFGRARPFVDTIVPSGMKMLEIEHGLVEQAAAVVAQVEHDALRALGEQLVDRLADLAVRAGGEAGEPDVGDLLAAGLPHLGLDDRDVDARALELDVARRLLAGGDRQA